MNVVAWIIAILGGGFLIAAAGHVRAARGSKKKKPPNDITVTLTLDACDFTRELERIRLLLDPKNEHGTADWFAPRLAVPPVGSLWKHKNGNIYRVKGITNIPPREGHEVGVLYQNVRDNIKWWHRDLKDWHRSFTYIID